MVVPLQYNQNKVLGVNIEINQSTNGMRCFSPYYQFRLIHCVKGDDKPKAINQETGSPVLQNIGAGHFRIPIHV